MKTRSENSKLITLFHASRPKFLAASVAPNRRVVTFMRLAFKKEAVLMNLMGVFHRLTFLRRR